jgi:hypothetical protein
MGSHSNSTCHIWGVVITFNQFCYENIQSIPKSYMIKDGLILSKTLITSYAVLNDQIKSELVVLWETQVQNFFVSLELIYRLKYILYPVSFAIIIVGMKILWSKV